MQLHCFEALADQCFFERQARSRGFRYVAGIDEAGRGPLAGPVAAAAVLLPPDAETDLEAVRDSKQLTASQREACYEAVVSRALGVGIACVEAPDIDRLNILQATFRAMVQAVRRLPFAPDFLLIDGPYRLPVSIAQQGIRGGDRRSLSIAAASVIAKVHRDRLMDEHHRLYPAYQFNRNKGYATAAHREALRRHGPCAIHRLSFKGVRGEKIRNSNVEIRNKSQ